MNLGALEAGGTKMIVSVGDETGKVFDRQSFPTLNPDVTMPELIGFFKDKNIEALGIGSFGPLDLNENSPTFGHITTSPKVAWRNVPIAPMFKEALGVPVGIDTDVNAACLAEARLGAAKGANSCLYVTIGTGIGGGVMINGTLVHGLVHPEWGHILIKPHPADPLPRGVCPYHEGCLEGLASGPSFDARFGISSKELPKGHIGWEIEAYYLAQLCAVALLTLSMEHIVLGGGVMQSPFLLDMVRKETVNILGGYIADERVLHHLDKIITEPGLSTSSGVVGALLLAKDALDVG